MQIEYNNQKVNVPDFFVVGAPKCGTTSLYDSFSKSNIFFLPKIKEPQFFAYRHIGSHFCDATGRATSNRKRVIVSSEEYFSLFSDAPSGRLIGDFSTHHLRFSEEFIKNIRDIYGKKAKDVKIVVLLRDPLKRAYSHYMMRIRNGSETLSFGEAIKPEVVRKRMDEGYLPSYDYIRFSEYSDDINRLREVFEHVQVLYFEDLIRSSEETVRRFGEFVGVRQTDWTDTFQLANSNKSGVPKKGFANRLAFNLIFKNNIIKRALPARLKNSFRDLLKNKIGSGLMKKQEMDRQTRSFAYSLLEKEYAELATIAAGRYNKDDEK